MTFPAEPSPLPQGQEIFRKIYQGKQSFWRHLSYMRSGKVFLALEILRQHGVRLRGQRIFDYGFGAGTLFTHLPRDAHFAGVEQDPVVCREVQARLCGLGYRDVDLQPIEPKKWRMHPLLLKKYDLIVCSHVLEHLEKPADLLRAFGKQLTPGGRILALVPLNERKDNPHHLQQACYATISGWAETAGLRLACYVEADPWLYWAQPLFTYDHGWPHRLGQAINLLTGILAYAVGSRAWFRLARPFEVCTGSRPTQAGFILSLE